jgi:hypothetical protein
LQKKAGKLSCACTVGMRKGQTKDETEGERDGRRGESTGGYDQAEEEEDFRYHSESVENDAGEGARATPALRR